MSIFRFLIKITPQRWLQFLKLFFFSKGSFSFLLSLTGCWGAGLISLPWIRAWSWHMGITHPLGVQLLCLVVPWTSWTARAPSSYLFFLGWCLSLETSVCPRSILSLEKIWFEAKFEPADGKVWESFEDFVSGRKTGKVSFNPGQNFNGV